MCHPFHHVITGTEVKDCQENRLAHLATLSDEPSLNRRDRRVWLQSIIAGGAAVIAILRGRNAQAVQVATNPPPGMVTTQALGEEGGVYRPPIQPPVTTQALGEEGGRYRTPTNLPVTTFALGEEGSDYYQSPRYPFPPRFQIPRRYPYPSRPVTTYALGEEGAGFRRFP